jgi:hypothetical protein
MAVIIKNNNNKFAKLIEVNGCNCGQLEAEDETDKVHASF